MIPIFQHPGCLHICTTFPDNQYVDMSIQADPVDAPLSSYWSDQGPLLSKQVMDHGRVLASIIERAEHLRTLVAETKAVRDSLVFTLLEEPLPEVSS